MKASTPLIPFCRDYKLAWQVLLTGRLRAEQKGQPVAVNNALYVENSCTGDIRDVVSH